MRKSNAVSPSAVHTVLSLVLVGSLSIAADAKAGPDLIDILPSLIPGEILTANGTAETTRPASSDPMQAGMTRVDTGFAYGTFTPSGDLGSLASEAFRDFQNLPVGSAVAAFTYYFDPESNVFKKSNQGLGPIFADRAQTLGKGKLNLGVSWAHVDYDEIEGTNLSHVPIQTTPNQVFVDTYSDTTVGAIQDVNTMTGNGDQASSLTNNFTGGPLYPTDGLSYTCSNGLYDLPLTIGNASGFDNANFFAACTGPDGDYTTRIVGGSDLAANIDLTVDVINLYASYGVLDNFDVGILLPLLQVDLRAKVSYTTISSTQLDAALNAIPGSGGALGCAQTDLLCLRDGVDFGLEALFRNVMLAGSGDAVGDQKAFINAVSVKQSANDSETDFGIGDLMIRGKYRFLESRFVDMAGRLDMSFPTGDEDNFRSTGEYMWGLNLIASKSIDWFSPHANVGLQLRTGGKENHQFRWVVGADARVIDQVAASVDFIGSEDLYHDGIGDTEMAIAPGVKVNPWENLVVSGAAIVRLNSQGLRADVIPAFNIEYTFF